MNLAILGGTGRTGRLLIDLALLRGDTVRVLARDPSRLHRHEERLIEIQGDARDPEAITRAITGAGAVLSALGPVRDAPQTMTTAARNLTTLMPGAGVRRLVTLTGAGVPAEGDRPGPVDLIFRTLLRLTQPAVLADSLAHADLIRASTLDWTVVRAPRLTDGPLAPLKVGRVGEIRPQVSRASVAQFMLDQVSRSEHVRGSPAISN